MERSTMHRKMTIYRCKFCGENYNEAKDLIAHKKDMHLVEIILAKRQKMINYPDSANVTNQNLERKIVNTEQQNNALPHEGSNSFLRRESDKSAGNNVFIDESLIFNISTSINSDDSLICNICYKDFHNREKLSKHMQNVHPKRTYGCPFCPYTSIAAQHIRMHMKSIHESSEQRRIHCKFCNGSFFSKGVLENHVRQVHMENGNDSSPLRTNSTHVTMVQPEDCYQAKPRCQYCPFSAFTITHVRKHENDVHHRQNEFKCSKCTASYQTLSHLNVHMSRLHKCPTGTASDSESEVEETKKKVMKIRFSSPAWRRVSNSFKINQQSLTAKDSEEEMKDDMNVAENSLLEAESQGRRSSTLDDNCSYSNVKFPGRRRQAEDNMILKKIHKCPLCAYSSSISSNVKAHIRNLHGEDTGRIKCPHCSASCKSHGIARHIQFAHGGRPKKISSKTSTVTQQSIKVIYQPPHVVASSPSKNKPLKNFKCSRCPMCFYSAGDVRRHVVSVHLMKHEYECGQCSATYKNLHTLTFHEKCHQSREKIQGRPASNQIKPKRDNNTLPTEDDRDEKVRRKFVCSECSQSFVFKAQLNMHMRNKHTSSMNSTHGSRNLEVATE